MASADMEVQKYLERINFPINEFESINATKEVLFKLQRCHILSVPYENIDVLLEQKIELNV